MALGGTGYAAVKINGKDIRNGTVTGAKLKSDTLGGTQVKESELGEVPRAASAGVATRADTAGQADTASAAGIAASADSAATLGGLGPQAFARASQFQQAGPFTTNPAGPDRDFFYFPDIDLRIVTPRAPNAPGGPGLIEIQHSDSTKPIWASVRGAGFSSGGPIGETSSGINYPVNGPGAGDDFIDMTFHSVTTGVVVKLECVADANATNIPVTCSALRFSP